MAVNVDQSVMTAAQRVALREIEALDLGYMREQVRRASGDEAATAADRCYREFLFVTWVLLNDPAGRRNRVAAPCACADRMWHEHILVTTQYRADCERVFGAYLNHVPADYPLGNPRFGEVSDGNRYDVREVYERLGLTYCPEPRDRCIWCIT